MLYENEEKRRESKPIAKPAETTQSAAHPAVSPTQQPAWTQAMGDHLPASLQTKLTVNQPGDAYEQEADQVEDKVIRMAASGSSMLAVPPEHPGTSPHFATSVSHVQPMIQRAALEESTASPSTTTESAPTSSATTTEPTPTTTTSTAEAAPTSAPPNETPTSELIVEDETANLGPGQMKKSDFLGQLRSAVCTTTEEALKGTIWSSAGCPWVDHWFDYYSSRDSQQIERAIRRYAPDTADVTRASDYIPIICGRVRSAIAVWSTTGEVTGVPEGMDVPGTGLMGAVGGVMSGIASVGSSIASGAESIASGIASAGASAVSGVGSVLSGIGSLFSKGREGGAREVSNPQAIQGQLGSSRSLDSNVRSPMEAAFGADFSHVRVHTDATATGLSESLNARAFTVGRDVAFGPGEYQPGTLVGDALIAHELAHVVQQGGTSTSPELLQKGDVEYSSLEEDADVSAVSAVVSLWNGAKGGLANIAQNAMPGLRSGLRLQRCAGPGAQRQPTVTTPQPAVANQPPSDQFRVVTRGAVAYTSRPEDLPSGTVEVRQGDVVEASSGARAGNLFALQYSGTQSATTKWLQFAWFEITATTPHGTVHLEDSIPVEGGGDRPLTNVPSRPQWFVDSPSTTDPFYESRGASIRSSTATTIFDQPGGSIEPIARALFVAEHATSVTFTAHFATFLIQNNVAVYHVPWTATFTFTQSSTSPPITATSGSLEQTPITYSVGAAGAAQGLPPNLSALLHTSYRDSANVR